ncbi:MAG TPA: single-stranded DNA-binding protein [bacterium]
MAYGKGSVNKVLLLGRLGKDPDLKYTPSGVAVATFSVATNLAWKDQEGNQKEQTEWHRVVAWRKSAEIASNYLKKGNQVFVEGRLQTRSWNDKNNLTHYMTEVVADNLVLIGGKMDRAGEPSEIPPPADEFVPGEPEAAPAPSEDDLPF